MKVQDQRRDEGQGAGQGEGLDAGAAKTLLALRPLSTAFNNGPAWARPQAQARTNE